jgi:hypothetical protein
MSNFWQQRFVQQQPQAPAAPPSPTQPWWMAGRTPAPNPVQQATTQQAAQEALNGLANGSVAPSGESHFGDLLAQDGYHTEKAQSAKDSEPCPDCGSPNYIAPKGHPNAMKQCFECGYNPRFAHSTAGASGIGQQNVADPRPARAQNVATGAPPMGTVIGHI